MTLNTRTRSNDTAAVLVFLALFGAILVAVIDYMQNPEQGTTDIEQAAFLIVSLVAYFSLAAMAVAFCLPRKA